MMRAEPAGENTSYDRVLTYYRYLFLFLSHPSILVLFTVEIEGLNRNLSFQADSTI